MPLHLSCLLLIQNARAVSKLRCILKEGARSILHWRVLSTTIESKGPLLSLASMNSPLLAICWLFVRRLISKVKQRNSRERNPTSSCFLRLVCIQAASPNVADASTFAPWVSLFLSLLRYVPYRGSVELGRTRTILFLFLAFFLVLRQHVFSEEGEI